MTAGATIGGLFEGYGGLTAAVQHVVGGEVAWVAENDPAASRLLAHHYPTVPNLGDVTAVDWSSVPRVDVITGGFPCQDVSLAGRRGGMTADSRSGLWSHMAVAIDRLRPRLVVIENVRGVRSVGAHSHLEPCPWCMGDGEIVALRALGAVLGDLADLGYDAQWCGVRAADVGAPHGRYRVFITAAPVADADRVGPQRPDPGGGARRGQRPAHDGASPTDAEGDRRAQRQPQPAGAPGRPDVAGRGDGAVADADRAGLALGQGIAGDARPQRATAQRGDRPVDDGVDWGIYEPAIRRWEVILGRPSPTPTVAGRRAAAVLNPAFVEWLMGLPEAWVTGVPGLSRNDQLRLLGNGVVPQQAVRALELLSRTGTRAVA